MSDWGWIEYAYFEVFLCALVLSVANWRFGMYLALFFDVLRDPVRKVAGHQSVLITVSAGAIWFAVCLGIVNTQRGEILSLFRRYRKISFGFQWISWGLIPGTVLSFWLYVNGWKLVVIGALSYLTPLIGIIIGYVFAKSERTIFRFLACYVVLNSLALVGTPLEYSGVQSPLFGGLRILDSAGKPMVWVRYEGTYIVHLISGIYRSPDIMGLHAAHVVMFSLILAWNPQSRRRKGWLLTAVWGAFCVLLSGRRKMIGIPLVFVVAHLMLGAYRGSRQLTRAARFAVGAAVVGIGLSFALSDGPIAPEYMQFASTLVTKGTARAHELIVGSVEGTIDQEGWFGGGLGSATQGSHHFDAKLTRSWQEDGVSRLFKELGFPGILCLLIAAGYFGVATREALLLTPVHTTTQQLQLAFLSVVAANAASFAVSHQQYSGDPVTSLLVLIFVGMVFGAPRIYAAQQKLQLARAKKESTETLPAKLSPLLPVSLAKAILRTEARIGITLRDNRLPQSLPASRYVLDREFAEAAVVGEADHLVAQEIAKIDVAQRIDSAAEPDFDFAAKEADFEPQHQMAGVEGLTLSGKAVTWPQPRE